MSILSLSTNQYDSINTTMTDLFQSGTVQAVTITIFHDAEGNQIVEENGKPIHNLTITSIAYTQEHTDADNNIVNPTITFNFSDETCFISTDTVNNYFYQLNGVPFSVRTFGNSQ